ncbi:phosphonate C-P lyase system protein PhnH [Dyella acidisoli]|uniref:Carbon-phosphorus lyase subunit PhnH n=1 Tax=Dyella acidisoli TaxID=1867834 RepID=A0ABQ5XP48_9GAMM|nr:phosphonate C-P lyase system protein PhnH [Dyella acidisoli]GLQ93147.1 carbon-phosphorus lyase subunit PhnH [Dyella acidisoli]
MLAAFANPVFDSQRTFRELLQAMARPAVPRALPVLPPAPESVAPAAMAILLTLCDAATALWLQQPVGNALEHLRFHTGLRVAQTAKEADFALITAPDAMPSLQSFAQGELRYPDRSTSLIVQVQGFRNEAGVCVAGPGIRDQEMLHIEGLPADFWTQRAALAESFPLGIDMFFVAEQHVLALPRTTRLLEH